MNESTLVWLRERTAAHLPYDCNNYHEHTNTVLTPDCRQEFSTEWSGLVWNAKIRGAVSLQEEDQLCKGPDILAGSHGVAFHKNVNSSVLLEKNWVIHGTRVSKNQNTNCSKMHTLLTVWQSEDCSSGQCKQSWSKSLYLRTSTGGKWNETNKLKIWIFCAGENVYKFLCWKVSTINPLLKIKRQPVLFFFPPHSSPCLH